MRCVHCLKEVDKTTKDHVFPAAWYPDNTPEKVQRPTVPSCAECNNTLGAIEKELFLRLAMCIDPAKVEASGINKRLYRSFGIGVSSKEVGKEERKIRLGKLKDIMKGATRYSGSAKPFPGLGFHVGRLPEEHLTIPVPEKELIAVSKKIIRGSEYIYGNKRYIEEPFEVEVYFVNEDADIGDVTQLLGLGYRKDYGPGFVVERVAAMDSSRSVMYKIIIWGTLKIYGSVMIP